MPKISIIVPIYNAEKFLHKCINSILCQTFSDFELILVDDGSPDNSGKICDEYERRDHRVTVIHKKNGGVSSARNAGIEVAKGEYICFVDSDDYVERDYIECLVNTKSKYPNIKNIWCSFYVLSDSEDIKVNSYESGNSGKVIVVSKKQIMTIHEKWLTPMPWNKLYEAEIIKCNNIKMDEELSLGEDFIFNIEYIDFANSDDILIINKPLVYYKSDNENSLDNKYYKNLLQIYQKINSQLKKYLLKWNADEEEIKKYYNTVYFSYERILKNTMSRNNSDSFYKKIKYNNSIIKSDEFNNCIKNMQYNLPVVLKTSYKIKNYYFIYLYENLISKVIQFLKKGKGVMSDILKKIIYKFHIDKAFGVISSAFIKCFSKKLNIYNVDSTVEYIINNKCSVSRFGDGELHIATEGCGIGFQKADKELQKRLRDVIKTKSDKLLLCLPSPINDFSYMTPTAQEVWKKDLKYNRYYWYRIIDKSMVYGDTQFTRPYIDYQNRENSKQRFENIKKIWKDRRILIVEGEKSRLGINNDLFERALEIKRILCPPKDAFSKYYDILNEVLKHSKDYLVLIALGPTATVLAKDLSESGYQAIDIGHIDIEYEWCRMNVNDKVAVSGKYTNETGNQTVIKDEKNKEYLSQICGRIE